MNVTWRELRDGLLYVAALYLVLVVMLEGWR